MSQRTTIQAQTSPEKQSAMLVRFITDGGLTEFRVTDFTSHVDLLGDRFIPVPKMDIQLAANTGGLSDSPHGIVMPLSGFTRSFSIGEAHPFIDVEIIEKIVGEKDSSAQVMFYGRAVRSIRNYQGNPTATKILFTSWKSRMNVPLGMQANPTCNWGFTKRGCALGAGVGLETNKEIVNISKATVTFAALDFPADDGRYRRGYVEYMGLRIGIREHTVALGNSVILVREPPRSWLGLSSVAVKAGCDKQSVTCDTRWGNIANFGAIGAGIPKYHPIIEGV